MSKRVLVVDDSNVTRLAVSFALKESGYIVFEAPNPKVAGNILNSNNIDMVITDLNMPEMSGIDFIKSIRSNIKYKNLPVILVTGESKQDKKDEGKQAGVNGWAVKPVKPEQILALVRRFIG